MSQFWKRMHVKSTTQLKNTWSCKITLFFFFFFTLLLVQRRMFWTVHVGLKQWYTKGSSKRNNGGQSCSQSAAHTFSKNKVRAPPWIRARNQSQRRCSFAATWRCSTLRLSLPPHSKVSIAPGEAGPLMHWNPYLFAHLLHQFEVGSRFVRPQVSYIKLFVLKSATALWGALKS